MTDDDSKARRPGEAAYTRKAGNWIQGFRFYTQESECPDSFILWTAIHTISSALERRVYAKWGYYKFYPNIYVLLIAPPGCRKSTAIRFGKKMLQEVGVPTSSDSLSRESLIAQMIERGRGAQALAVAVGEFTHMIQTSGANMVTFLTDIYDSEDNWEYGTLKRGVDSMPAPYLTLLGGIVPDKIESLSQDFIATGLASRCVYAVEDKPRFRKALPKITDEMLAVREALVEDLMHITTLEGEFEWADDATEWFTEWYETVHGEIEDATEMRFKGYMTRKPTHVVRLSQILAIAENDELILTKQLMLTAKELLDHSEPKMIEAFSSMGRNPIATDLERIASDIMTAPDGGLSKGELIKRYSHNLRKDELDEILEQLEMMGLAKIGLKQGQPWVQAVL